MYPATISTSIMVANMWKDSLKNVESDNNKILYEILLDFLHRKGTYLLNKQLGRQVSYRLSLFYAERTTKFIVIRQLVRFF